MASEVTGKRAYVTLLAGSGNYVKGVVVLAKSLRKVKSAYPLVVAVLPDVPEAHRDILKSQGCIVREVEPVYPPQNHQVEFVRAYFVVTYCKLAIWGFEDYTKMIYLDGDIQVKGNIDHLFDMPNGYIYGVMSCFCEKIWSPTPQYRVGYCPRSSDKAKATWPSGMGADPAPYFNAGMFVFEPSRLLFEKLLQALQVTPLGPFGDQDFLNKFFRDVLKPIPYIYNLFLSMLWRHPEIVELDKVKVVHFLVAGSKPWEYTGKEPNMDREDVKMLVKEWWDVYNDKSLDYEFVDNS